MPVEYDGETFAVVPVADSSCNGCVFYTGNDGGRCVCPHDFPEACAALFRDDNTSVVFTETTDTCINRADIIKHSIGYML